MDSNIIMGQTCDLEKDQKKTSFIYLSKWIMNNDVHDWGAKLRRERIRY